MLAARMIVAIENPADVMCISSRPFGQRAVLKYSHYTGSQCIAGRFTPGTFTNQKTKQFKEPRLLVITDPRIDSQAVKEASYTGIPVISLCDSDSSELRGLRCPLQQVQAVYWPLYRLGAEVPVRGTITRDAAWEVPADPFFYRDLRSSMRRPAPSRRCRLPRPVQGLAPPSPPPPMRTSSRRPAPTTPLLPTERRRPHDWS